MVMPMYQSNYSSRQHCEWLCGCIEAGATIRSGRVVEVAFPCCCEIECSFLIDYPFLFFDYVISHAIETWYALREE